MEAGVRFLRVAGALVIAVVLSAGPVLAQNPRSGQQQRRHRTAWFEREDVQQALGLTETQIASLSEATKAHREKLPALRRAQREAYRALFEALGSEKPDPAAVEEARKDLETAILDLNRAGMDHWIALRKILTKAQWEQLPNVAPRALRLGSAVAMRGHGSVRAGQVSTAKPQH